MEALPELVRHLEGLTQFVEQLLEQERARKPQPTEGLCNDLIMARERLRATVLLLRRWC